MSCPPDLLGLVVVPLGQPVCVSWVMGIGAIAALPVDPLLLVLRWLHILPMAFAVGGAVFVYAVLQPAAAELPDEAHDSLRAGVRRRLAKLVHISIALMLITGMANFFLVAIPQLKAHGSAMPYHALFGVKFLIALAAFANQSLLVGRSGLAVRWQAQARRWVAVNVVLLVGLVALSGFMGQLRQGYVQAAAQRATATAVAPTTVATPPATMSTETPAP